jgi:hypothetical protein
MTCIGTIRNPLFLAGTPVTTIRLCRGASDVPGNPDSPWDIMCSNRVSVNVNVKISLLTKKNCIFLNVRPYRCGINFARIARISHARPFDG